MEGQRFSNDEIRLIVERLGYEFVGLEIKKESGSPFFRVYIDSLGGISVRDCEIVSRGINRALEEKGQDLLDERYYLEVSSPGLERPLCNIDDFRRFTGKAVSLRFRELMEGHRRVTGKINAVDQDGVIDIVSEEGSFKVVMESILSAKLVYIPEKNPKPHSSRRQKKKKKKDNSLEGDR